MHISFQNGCFLRRCSFKDGFQFIYRMYINPLILVERYDAQNPFKDVCFLYQYVSKHELDNQGVALHLFRASKYIGKIRLSNSIQTFCINMNSVIVMSCSTKYYTQEKWHN